MDVNNYVWMHMDVYVEVVYAVCGGIQTVMLRDGLFVWLSYG